MKKLQYLFLGLIVIASACSKDDEKQVEISNEQAAEMIASSLTDDSGGLMTIFTQSADIAAEVGSGSSSGKTVSCGFSDETSFSFASDPGEDPSFSMDYDYSFTVNCDDNSEISDMDLSMIYSGFLTTENVNIIYDGDTQFNIDGLSSEVITYNGHYTGKFNTDISGDQSAKIDLDYEYTLTDIQFSTGNYYIMGGTAAVKLSGSTDEGSFDIVASITYHDNNTATILVNSETYTANLSTGDVTKG